MTTNSVLADDFKTALRGVASSVTIFSTRVGGVRYGMVATAVMSVSMAPASLVIAVNKSASINERIADRGYFAVNVLSERDRQLSVDFANAKGEARFHHGIWHDRSIGQGEELPYLVTAQAAIFCQTSHVYSHGTHILYVGEVVEVIKSANVSPLMYCNGQYGAFTDQLDLERIAS